MRKPSRSSRRQPTDRSPRRAPQRLSEILPQLMARRGYAQLINAEDFDEVWQQVAGRLAAVSRPGRLQRGVLQITVNSSAAVQELTFQKRQLLRAICEKRPDQKIRDLRFVVGPTD